MFHSQTVNVDHERKMAVMRWQILQSHWASWKSTLIRNPEDVLFGKKKSYFYTIRHRVLKVFQTQELLRNSGINFFSSREISSSSSDHSVCVKKLAVPWWVMMKTQWAMVVYQVSMICKERWAKFCGNGIWFLALFYLRFAEISQERGL